MTMSAAFLDVFRLAGQVALVTGASRGLGAAMARGLAAAGACVAICSRKAEPLEKVAAEVRAQGGDVLAAPAHVGRDDEVAALVARTVETFGRLDIVVNNAAVNPVYAPLAQLDDGAFDKILAVNLKGPWLVAKHAYPHLRTRGGSVINVGSVAGLRPEPGLGLYGVSKAALHSLTQAMAREWGPDGIRVNAICPGLVQTDFSAALWNDAQTLRSFLERTPLGRLAQPEEIVPLAIYLASPASAFCTGALFTIDGGATI